MVIKVLHIHDCPSWNDARQNLEAALVLLGIEEVVETMEITTAAQSLEEDFGGSPTITCDGKDIFAHSDEITNLACRVYFTPEGLRSAPSTDMVVSALNKLTLP